MVTIGDVLAIIAALAGTGITAWALIVVCALLLPGKVSIAKVHSISNIRTDFGLGILMLLPILIGAILLGTHRPAGMILGYVLILSVFTIGTVGMAGLCGIASDQICSLSPNIDPFSALLRGAGFLVTACMLPILGWFVFTPFILLASFGGGLRSLVGKSGVRAPAIVDPSAV